MLMLYLHGFCDSMFSFEIFSIHLTLICFKCLLRMKKHIYKVIPFTFVGRSSRLNGKWKNITKKRTYIMLVPSQRYQYFWQLLQTPKVPKIVLGFSNHAHRFTPPYFLDIDNPFYNFIKCCWIRNIFCAVFFFWNICVVLKYMGNDFSTKVETTFF